MTSGPAGPAAPTADRRGRVGFGITAGVLAVIMLGGTLPVPLYVLWGPEMGFGPLGVTVVFVAYVIGTLSALLGFGQLSDHIGRTKVMAPAIVLAALSTAIFLAAASIGVLIVARIISGLAVGLIGGTATAALAELSGRAGPQRAAVVASGANLGGLALGPLAAGLFAQYVPVPTRAVFWAYLALCAVLLAAVPAIPETVRQPDRAFRVHLRVGVPARMRPVMLGAGLAVFAAFALLGLFSSLVPTFVRGVLGIGNLAVAGLTVFLIFAVAAITQAASARLASRRSVTAGLPLLLAGLAALEISLFVKAEWLFYAATVAGGIAVGLIFRGGLTEINRQADPAHRAEAVSTYFAAAYLGLGVPVLLIGLAAVAVGPIDASAWVAGLVAAIILTAALVVIRTFGTTAQAAPSPARCDDSWCNPQLAGGPAATSASHSRVK
jgi:MFS family permease